MEIKLLLFLPHVVLYFEIWTHTVIPSVYYGINYCKSIVIFMGLTKTAVCPTVTTSL